MSMVKRRKEPCDYGDESLGLSDGVSGESVVWQAWGDVLDRVSEMPRPGQKVTTRPGNGILFTTELAHYNRHSLLAGV